MYIYVEKLFKEKHIRSTQQQLHEKDIFIAVDEKTFQPWTKIYGLQTMPHMENNTHNSYGFEWVRARGVQR